MENTTFLRRKSDDQLRKICRMYEDKLAAIYQELRVRARENIKEYEANSMTLPIIYVHEEIKE